MPEIYLGETPFMNINKLTVFIAALLMAQLSNAGSYYDKSLTSIAQYRLTAGTPNTDEVTDEWFEGAFVDAIKYDTQEFSYRSPRYKDFSVDFTTLLNAGNDREKFSAALKWKGIKISHETGSAKGQFITPNGSNDLFVNAGDALPTRCVAYWAGDCVDKVMVEAGKEVEMEFEGNKLQFTFAWQEGMQSVMGISTYDVQTPLLLSREVDVDSTVRYSSGGTETHTYKDTELWGSVIDSKGEMSSKAVYFGIDASELRLIEAYENNKIFHHGFVGSIFTMISEQSFKSSGEQEQLLSDLYGIEVEKAEDFVSSSEAVFSFEYTFGYMLVFQIDRNSKSQAFIQAGVRGVFLFSDTFADEPYSESRYVIDEISGDTFNGYFVSMGSNF